MDVAWVNPISRVESTRASIKPNSSKPTGGASSFLLFEVHLSCSFLLFAATLSAEHGKRKEHRVANFPSSLFSRMVSFVPESSTPTRRVHESVSHRCNHWSVQWNWSLLAIEAAKGGSRVGLMARRVEEEVETVAQAVRDAGGSDDRADRCG